MMHQKLINITKLVGVETAASSINHLLSITYEIYKSFNDGYKVR